ncbi:MAG: dual specificity protein phosphatase family protein [Spirochaetia bacterium]
MQQVHTNFFIGNDHDCARVKNDPHWVTVHACQSCYDGAIITDTSRTLFFEKSCDLYLDLLDIQDILKKDTHPMVVAAFNFIDIHIEDKNVLIHCNFGASRSPSIAFLYLCKKGVLQGSYLRAMDQFLRLYPSYHPGSGMARYCQEYWKELT